MSAAIRGTHSFLSLFVGIALAAFAALPGCQPSSSGRSGDVPPAQTGSPHPVEAASAPGLRVSLVEGGTEASASTLDGSFRFVLTDFHFEKGTEAFVVGADGSVKDLFVRHERVKTAELCANAKSTEDKDLCTQMRKDGAKEFGVTKSFLAHYTFSPEALSVFRSLLRSAKFETLKPSYSVSNLHDGVTNTYTLQAGGKTHRVSAYAADTPAEPERLLAVRTFLVKQAQVHEAERKNAPELSFNELQAFQNNELGAP